MDRMWLLASALFCNSVFALGGEFTLRADDGGQYSLSQSHGKAVVVLFGYTYCPDVCPTGLATVAAALNTLGEQARQVDALFVSLDPDRDTPQVLHGYTRYFDPRIRGLTGDAKTIAKVADAYRVKYNFVGKGKTERYTVDHSAQYFVIDRDGQLVQILPHGIPPSAVANSLRRVLADDPDSSRLVTQNASIGAFEPPHR